MKLLQADFGQLTRRPNHNDYLPKGLQQPAINRSVVLALAPPQHPIVDNFV